MSGTEKNGPGAASPVLPTDAVKQQPTSPRSRMAAIHPGVYIATWIALSSTVILYNKYILDRLGFHFPIFLTTFHLAFATCMTQLLARTTSLLDSRKNVAMNGKIYLKAIVPIGFFFSLSLICGNIAYLYLSVSFIQMLKATTPVVVLLTGWALGTQSVDMKKFFNVCIIVVGVMIASAGEIKFILVGVLVQIAGLSFEAIRIVMVERLLSSKEYRMDPIVSLYYYAPACTVMNGLVFLFMELPRLTLADIYSVGLPTLFLNALVAFALNVAVVLLINRTSSLVYTLSGVIKDIILVVASVVLFGDPVSLIQIFGYGIALAGLVYYKLGAQSIKDYVADVTRAWGKYGLDHPGRRRGLVFCATIMSLIIVLRTVGVSGDYAQSKISDLIGEHS